MSKILAIDDEPALLHLFRAALVYRGHEVFASGTLDEALRILRTESIDLVMLDIHMPQKSGFEIYREIRQRTAVPVLFVTGDPRAFTDPSRPGARILQEEVAKGNAGVLFKPFDVPTLYRKTEELLHRKDGAAVESAPPG